MWEFNEKKHGTIKADRAVKNICWEFVTTTRPFATTYFIPQSVIKIRDKDTKKDLDVDVIYMTFTMNAIQVS